MHRFRLDVRRAAVASLLGIVLWQVLLHGTAFLEWRGVATFVSQFGWASLYLVGLLWLVWGMERASQRLEAGRLQGPEVSLATPAQRNWNPLDPEAWFYGRESQRLKQSLAALGFYSLVFLMLYFQFTRTSGAASVEPFDLPAGGGGQEAAVRQAVRIQKVVGKKYVINPYSSILFNPPAIDHVDTKLQLLEVTQELYQIGQGDADGQGGSGGGKGTGIGSGDGEGSGFGKGTGKGKIRLVRLKHSDRLWDKNFGIGADQNMLNEYGARTRQKIAERTEALEVSQLAGLSGRDSPPLVFVTGGSTFLLTPIEKKILRQYLLEKHGMIVGDNLGGRSFHDHFIAAMREVIGAQEVPVPRYDRVHKRLYPLPSLPIVVAHGGTVPLGWNVDGRWVAYYHPGALSDAWRDDHAGIKKEIYEECYQLGVNLIFYAYWEKNKWLESQKH